MLRAGLRWMANLVTQQAAIDANSVAMTRYGLTTESWSKTTAGSFRNARKNIGLTGIAFGLLGAAVTGWQIGSYLNDQFLEARLAGVAFVDGTKSGWENIKYGAKRAWAAIGYAFARVIEGMRNEVADFFADMASRADAIPDWLGGGKMAEQYQRLADALRPATDATADYHAELKSLDAEHEQALAKIHGITDGMADYEIAQDKAAKAAKGDAAATGDLAAKIKELLKQQAAAAKANAARIEQLQTMAQALDSVHAAAAARAESITEMREKLAGASQAQIDYNAAIRASVDTYVKLRHAGLSVADAQAKMMKERRQAAEILRLSTRLAKARADASPDVQDAYNAEAASAQNMARIVDSSAQSMSDAFAGWMTGTLSRGESFGHQMVDLIKRMVAQMIAAWAKVKIFGPILNSVMDGISGRGSAMAARMQMAGQMFGSQVGQQQGGGSWGSMLSSYFGGSGGGIAGWLGDAYTAGQSGGGFGSTTGWISAGKSLWTGFEGGFSDLWTSVSGWFGAAGATAASSAALSGTAVTTGVTGLTTGIGGAGATSAFGGYVGANVAGGGAAAGAASSVSWIPIIGWIVAAVLKNVSLYQEGYKPELAVNDNLYSMERLATMGLYDPGALTTLWTDKFLRAIGMGEFLANLFSGAAGAVNLWGR